MTEFLHIANSSLTPGQSKGDESTEGNSMITRDIDGELCDVYAREIVTVSSTCGQELLRAYYNNNVADALTLSLKDVYSDATNNASMLPPAPLPSRRTSNLPSNVHESELTHSALLEVMEERDRIHCHMVSESILHAYEVDELKERIGNLTSQIRESKKESDSAQSTGNDNDDKKLDGSSSHYRTEKSIQQDTEAELLSLCQQLAGEISARTEACLEVIRLQESRKIEREQYVAERQSLQDEVWQLRQRVNEQSEEIETAQQAVDVWKSAFEKCAALHPQAKMQDDA